MSDEVLTFEEFRRRVGASEQRTRMVLFALGLRPLRPTADQRETRYPVEWVDLVRAKIAQSKEN